MKLLNLKINKKLSRIILLSLTLAACTGTTLDSNSATLIDRVGTAASNITTTVYLSATPSIVAYNGTADIIWSSTNSSSCTSSPSGITNTTGKFTTPPLTTTTTYKLTCDGPTGKVSKSILIAVASAAIADAATACAKEPMRGRIYYYCDCGTGAEAGCVPGNDKNAGTTPSAPRQTIGNAAAKFRTLQVDDTVALCKGGAFNSAGDHSIGSHVNSYRCGTTGACNDLREYTPPSSIFVGTAKPIINISAGNDKPLFRFSASGGVRLLNLKLKGDVDDSTSSNSAFYIAYRGRDVTMCNLDIDGFGVAVYSESDDGVPNTILEKGNTKNIKLTGSRISNSRNQGFLGAADNLQINYNYWDGNGSHSVFTHALYFSSNNTFTQPMEVIGNYVRGQYGDKCRGVVIVGHVAADGFRFENNTVDIDAAAATGTCYGIGFSASNQNTAKFIRNAQFLNNTVKNGGSLAFSVGECPDCLIENNLIIQDWPSPWQVYGMYFAADGKRAGDDVSDRVRIRNNTVWFGPRINAGGYGIVIGNQGTGHIIENNTVTYTDTSAHDDGFSCYSYPLAPGSYASINNNHCHTPTLAAFQWERGSNNLQNWQLSGFDIGSVTGDPLFTTPGTDFKPKAGSPLIKTGSTPAYIGAFAP